MKENKEAIHLLWDEVKRRNGRKQLSVESWRMLNTVCMLAEIEGIVLAVDEGKRLVQASRKATSWKNTSYVFLFELCRRTFHETSASASISAICCF